MKKRKFQKPKKVNKKALKKRCDILFSKKIRARGYCQAEGKTWDVKCGGALQCAHIERRNNLRFRYDEKNCLSLCFGHHFWFHRNPLQFVEFLMRYYPELIDYVQAHRNELAQENIEDTFQRLQNNT